MPPINLPTYPQIANYISKYLQYNPQFYDTLVAHLVRKGYNQLLKEKIDTNAILNAII
jgi:hypothetical protein